MIKEPQEGQGWSCWSSWVLKVVQQLFVHPWYINHGFFFFLLLLPGLDFFLEKKKKKKKKVACWLLAWFQLMLIACLLVACLHLLASCLLCLCFLQLFCIRFQTLVSYRQQRTACAVCVGENGKIVVSISVRVQFSRKQKWRIRLFKVFEVSLSHRNF